MEPVIEQTRRDEQVSMEPATKKPREESSSEDNDREEEDMDGYTVQTNNRKKRRADAPPSATPPPNRSSKEARKSKPRIQPLVLDGLADETRTNPLAIKKALKDCGSLVTKTVTTKNGKVLVFPKTEEDAEKLMQTQLQDGLTLRHTKARTATNKTAPSIVILGVNPVIGEEDISDETGRTCKRIMSSKLNGQATWKVKMACSSEEERAEVLKTGVYIGLQHYKATAYISRKPVIQCYKCQGFQHVASACQSEQRCRKCGENHHSKDCTAEAPVCANCGGAHTASDFACPQFAKETTTQETTVLSYATAVSKGGNQVDCIRLACTIATSITTALVKRANIKVNASDICKDVADNVALHYKTNIKGEHVYHIAFGKKVKAANQ
jgi:hypothetical protein